MKPLYSFEIHSHIRNYTAEIHSSYDFFGSLAELPNHALLVDKNVYCLYEGIIKKYF